MIVVDTSALMAILLAEPAADACAACLEAEDEILISAVTLSEALIVAARRNLAKEINDLVEGLSMHVVGVTPATARRVAAAYEKWGKGLHPAGLNFGDCFAYVLAMERDCALLYVGDDFSKTDALAAVD